MLRKNSTDDILKYFSRWIGFAKPTWHKLSTEEGNNLHKNATAFFSGQNKKNIINVSYAVLAKRVVMVKVSIPNLPDGGVV